MTVRRFGFFLIGACAFLALASCGNDAVSSSDAVPEGMARITLVVNGARATAARDIYPHIDESQLTDLLLKGKQNNESETEIATATTLEALQSQTIDIATGWWTFTLEATLGGATYSGTCSVTVEQNKKNVVSFTLAEDTTQSGTVYGGFSLELAFTGSATKVTGEVQSLDGTTTVCTAEPLTITDGTVTYAKSATDENERIAAGTYRVVIVFYGGTNGDVLVNRYQEYVHIAGGVTTTTEPRTLDLNEVYTITYNYNIGDLGEGQSEPAQFSRRQAVTLPLAVRDGYIFAGWQLHDGEPAISALPKNTVGNVTLTAQWIAPLLYVAQDGTTVGKADGGTLSDGLTEAAALNTLEHGISQINSIAAAYADRNTIAGQNRAAMQDWTVQLSGHLAPASITGLSASSLVIKGKTGSSTDCLKGTGSGTVLNITDDIAVTVQDIGVAQGLRGIVQSGNGALTITGSWIGNNGTDSSDEQGGGIALLGNGTTLIDRSLISGNKAKDGAGIYVARGTLTIKDSTISGNTATGNGGGVYNAGTMFMYGSAVVGDGSKNETATEISYSNKGDGIYSTGTVYLGYSDASTPAALTGGIYYNSGAGVSIQNGTLVMNSGTIAYNYGRGVYAGSNDFSKYGTFTMNNGTISENGTETTDTGGGIYAGYHGKITVNGGTISGNTAKKGGGLGIANNDSHFTMTGGTISGNTATEKGGGVYSNMETSYTGSITMSGGTISTNAAATGKGVCIDYGPFTMSGSAHVASNNDVYLASGRTLTVGGAFDASVTAPVATITLPAANYVPGTQVLGGTADLLASEHGKFAVNESGWEIDSAGKLQKSVSGGITVTVPSFSLDGLTITSATNSDANGTVTRYAFTVTPTSDAYKSYQWVIPIGDDLAGYITDTTTENRWEVSREKFTVSQNYTLLVTAHDESGNAVGTATVTFLVN